MVVDIQTIIILMLMAMLVGLILGVNLARPHTIH